MGSVSPYVRDASSDGVAEDSSLGDCVAVGLGFFFGFLPSSFPACWIAKTTPTVIAITARAASSQILLRPPLGGGPERPSKPPSSPPPPMPGGRMRCCEVSPCCGCCMAVVAAMPMAGVPEAMWATGPVSQVPVWPPASFSIWSPYWTSPRISSALWNRSSGSLASERMTSPSSSGGTSAETCDGGTGVSCTCW